MELDEIGISRGLRKMLVMLVTGERGKLGGCGKRALNLS